MIRPINREKLGRMEPGQDLVTAGYIGELGVAAIAREKETELLNWFTRDYLRRIQTIENPAKHFCPGVKLKIYQNHWNPMPGNE